MVTTRRVTKAKELEAANALISPASPVQSDDKDDERGISDPMQISSPPPNDDVYSPPNSPMTIDPATRFTDQVTPTSPKDDYVDENEDVNENSNPNSPMHLDPPSDLNDLDTPTSPKGDSDTHEDIAPEGDLIIQFSDLITVRVSSSTLSQASTPLKDTIEEQRSRHLATAISMHKEMHEDDAYTLFRLLRLLHNCPDPGTAAEFRMFDIAGANLLAAVKDGAENLHQLAILVDKYQCQEALRTTFESLLSEFAFPSARDDMGLDQAVQLVTAVYLLNQPRYFQLFTKRLVTDYAVNWTKEGPNGLQKDFPPEIPTKQASLMKTGIYRQSNDANDALDMEIRGYSFGRCSKHVDNKCDDPRPKDLMIVRRITESINVPGKLFPANWCNRVTLR